jgi:hypothetical protein
MSDSRDATQSRARLSTEQITWLFICLALLAGFALLSATMVIPNAINKAQDDRETLEATLKTISDAKERSAALSQASSDLQAGIASLGSAIEAINDPSVKSILQREFRPVSESARRVDAIAASISRAYQRFGSMTERSPRYAVRIDLFDAIVPAARADQKKPGKGGGQQSSASIDLRKKYEDTVQQEQKIRLFERTFYGLGGLGVILIFATIFGPADTRTTSVEIAKIYLPSLLSSWGTFMAAISI